MGTVVLTLLLFSIVQVLAQTQTPTLLTSIEEAHDGGVGMTLEDQIEAVQLAEINKLKMKIKKLEEDNEKASLSLKNTNILTKFLKNILQNNQKEEKIQRDTIKAQAAELKLLGEERKATQDKNKATLMEALNQADIIRTQGEEANRLKEQIKTGGSLISHLTNLTQASIDKNFDLFPQYLQMMTKTLVDQNNQITKLREVVEDEQDLEDNLAKILERMDRLNVTFETDTEGWKLLYHYQGVIEGQSSSLVSLKPTISYVVRNNRKFDYKKDKNGNVLPVTPCQCLPETKELNITISGLQYSCPMGTVSKANLQMVDVMNCTNGICPDLLEQSPCKKSLGTPWSEWSSCSGPNCLYTSSRQRRHHSPEQGHLVNQTEIKGLNPLFVEYDTREQIYAPPGYTLGIFAVGGGGGSDDTYGGSSGFFKFQKMNKSGEIDLTIDVGSGGSTAYTGSTTYVRGEGPDKNLHIEARGGGGMGKNGWSGGGSDQGGMNGADGEGFDDNGSGERLPKVCEGVTLTPGISPQKDGDGTGGGGVIVNGRKPSKNWRRDGEGYGAGGGEDNHSGNNGVVIIMLCPL